METGVDRKLEVRSPHAARELPETCREEKLLLYKYGSVRLFEHTASSADSLFGSTKRRVTLFELQLLLQTYSKPNISGV